VLEEAFPPPVFWSAVTWTASHFWGLYPPRKIYALIIRSRPTGVHTLVAWDNSIFGGWIPGRNCDGIIWAHPWSAKVNDYGVEPHSIANMYTAPMREHTSGARIAGSAA